jgi:hypothetical protein
VIHVITRQPVWSEYCNLVKLQVRALPAPNGLLEEVTRQFWTLVTLCYVRFGSLSVAAR